VILRPGGAGVFFEVRYARGSRPWLLTTAPPGQTDSLTFVKPESYSLPNPYFLLTAGTSTLGIELNKASKSAIS
jgi:hypothetical protein